MLAEQPVGPEAVDVGAAAVVAAVVDTVAVGEQPPPVGACTRPVASRTPAAGSSDCGRPERGRASFRADQVAQTEMEKMGLSSSVTISTISKLLRECARSITFVIVVVLF